MIVMMLAATVLLADAAPAAAQPAAGQPTAPPAKQVKLNKDGLLCKNERPIGSRMPAKVCMTPEQWEERKASDRADLEKSQRTDLPGHD